MRDALSNSNLLLSTHGHTLPPSEQAVVRSEGPGFSARTRPLPHSSISDELGKPLAPSAPCLTTGEPDKRDDSQRPPSKRMERQQGLSEVIEDSPTMPPSASSARPLTSSLQRDSAGNSAPGYEGVGRAGQPPLSRTLGNRFNNQHHQPLNPDLIISAVADYFHLDRSTLTDVRSHGPYVTHARDLAVFLCRTLTDLPYSALLQFFEHKETDSLVRCYKRARERSTRQPDTARMVRAQIADIEKVIKVRRAA